MIAQDGEGALHGGPLGDLLVECMERTGAFISAKDLTEYSVIERAPIRGRYRGWEIVGPPPPAASGVHITQMLNILEGYDIGKAGLRHGRHAPSAGRGAEDRLRRPRRGKRRPGVRQGAGRAHHLEGLCRRAPRRHRPQAQPSNGAAGCWPRKAPTPPISPSADGKGNVVCTTQTINSLFGARFIVPGTGMIPNDYMDNFDPRPGNALSIAPGKRVTTSMSPMMALRDGKVVYALGLPGRPQDLPVGDAGADQPDRPRHGLQEAVEAPRIWTEGPFLEVEHGIPEAVRQGLEARGHKLVRMPTVAGGMNGIQFHDDGTMTGAACWRADGHAAGLGGGFARAGVRFVLPR